MSAGADARPRIFRRLAARTTRYARITVRAALAVMLPLLFSVPSGAQSPTSYTARLGWVPISGAERDDVAGRGQLTATLDGTTLAISGEFAGLRGVATIARLHEGVALGARGPAIADLSVTPATEGQVSGEVTLTAAQLSALEAGRLYVQLHSQRGVAPDHSNLWGWLLP